MAQSTTPVEELTPAPTGTEVGRGIARNGMMKKNLSIALTVGDTSLDPMARFDNPDEVNGFLDIFAKRGLHHVDTARMYSPGAPGSSEPRIGAAGTGERFIIDSKVGGREAGSHSKENVLKEIDISLKDLKIKQINIEYLHVPDRSTPFKEPAEAMDQAIKEGKIKQWGISNFDAKELQSFLDICEEHGLVKPSVYQGPYNPIMRGIEAELIPILRKHGMSYYAYSPAAGGFFAGNYKSAKAGSRYDKTMDVGKLYNQIYAKPSIIAATDKALEVASTHGISGQAAALRWTAHHGALNKIYGDAVILGASSPEQLESNLVMIDEGPLPDDVVSALEAVHEEIGHEVSFHL
ncbi:hypothetical protein G7046_g1852 [Stylonectria norvegica]|nr:hypothetical protein G7046_g1852 [Stylonectria norvegica]